ncbi:MAG: 16S rRNA (cytidine(1402)-2'-O)-methyltransferase [Herpetosiphon sp.]
MVTGTLYLVATPIGNLADITLRALEILRSVHLIAAEDTRHTRRLLNHYDISTPTTAYHEHNKFVRRGAMLAALEQGDVALVSDAGTPAINDPGFELVQAALEAGFAVVPLPGACAPIAALIASGLPTDRWMYLGFLPARGTARREVLSEFATLPATLVCFEAPHRLEACLRDLQATLGNRRMAVARELTKLHEEVVRGTVTEVQAHFSSHPPRGECTLVIDRAAPGVPLTGTIEESGTAAAAQLRLLAEQGMAGPAAVKLVAKQFGLTRAEVYGLWNGLRGGT